jgi:hypothetical protein
MVRKDIGAWVFYLPLAGVSVIALVMTALNFPSVVAIHQEAAAGILPRPTSTDVHRAFMWAVSFALSCVPIVLNGLSRYNLAKGVRVNVRPLHRVD